MKIKSGQIKHYTGTNKSMIIMNTRIFYFENFMNIPPVIYWTKVSHIRKSQGQHKTLVSKTEKNFKSVHKQDWNLTKEKGMSGNEWSRGSQFRSWSRECLKLHSHRYIKKEIISTHSCSFLCLYILPSSLYRIWSTSSSTTDCEEAEDIEEPEMLTDPRSPVMLEVPEALFILSRLALLCLRSEDNRNNMSPCLKYMSIQ